MVGILERGLRRRGSDRYEQVLLLLTLNHFDLLLLLYCLLLALVLHNLPLALWLKVLIEYFSGVRDCIWRESIVMQSCLLSYLSLYWYFAVHKGINSKQKLFFLAMLVTLEFFTQSCKFCLLLFSASFCLSENAFKFSHLCV